MAVTLTRAYGQFASGAKVIPFDDTESALVAQNLATVATSAPTETITGGPNQAQFITAGGNVYPFNVAGQGAPTNVQGPRKWPNQQNLTGFAARHLCCACGGSWYRARSSSRTGAHGPASAR